MNQGCPNLVFFTSNQVRKSKITLMKTKVFYIKKKKKNFAPRESAYSYYHQHINNVSKRISDN